MNKAAADAVQSLRPLLRPNSIAIIGASRTPGKSGHSVVRNLVNGGFQGRIFPVNPAGGEIEGLRCYPSVAALPERADCAMLVIPAADMVEAVRQCASAGVRTVIVGASGFAETGESEDKQRQDALAVIARDAGMRMLGPNTNGILNTVDRMLLGYNSEYRQRFEPGSISMVSHSGALFGGIARSLRRFGAHLCKFIPVGNEADIDILDVLEFLIHDDATRVIGLIVEGIGNGERLKRLAQIANHLGKPIVALKVGRSTVGAEATMAHSSRLAGSARAYDALFDACSIATVRSVEALSGGCALLADRTPRAGAGDQTLVCVTTSGAGGALLADFAAEKKIKLAGDKAGEWQDGASSIIGALPARGRIRNPIDMGSLDAEWLQLSDVFAAIEQDGLTGPAATYAHIAPRPAMDDALTRILIERKARTGTPAMVVAPGGLADHIEAQYLNARIPVFHDLSTAFESLQCHYSTLPKTPSTMVTAPAGGSLTAIRSKLESKLQPGQSILSELESADILREAGVPVVNSIAVRSFDEAAAAADNIGFPLVCKALAPGVAHKNEHGLVIVGVSDKPALKSAYDTLQQRLSQQGYERSQAPIILQPMIGSQVELIVGVSREPGLGHFLVAGLGGIYTEAYDEVTLVAIPASADEIRRRIEASTVGRIVLHLKTPGHALDQLVQALLGLQQIVMAGGAHVESIDVNPFLMGKQCVAVDALVILGPRPA